MPRRSRVIRFHFYYPVCVQARLLWVCFFFFSFLSSISWKLLFVGVVAVRACTFAGVAAVCQLQLLCEIPAGIFIPFSSCAVSKRSKGKMRRQRWAQTWRRRARWRGGTVRNYKRCHGTLRRVAWVQAAVRRKFEHPSLASSVEGHMKEISFWAARCRCLYVCMCVCVCALLLHWCVIAPEMAGCVASS